MRNPWGATKYTGPWSEHSSDWNTTWKAQALFDELREGEFYVDLINWRTFYAEAFNTHYNYFNGNEYEWKTSSIEGSLEKFAGGRETSEWIGFDNPQQQ